MNCVKNWCWKSAWRTAEKAYVGKGAWWAALKTAEKVTEKVSFQGNKVTSLKLKRRQCRLQLGTAMNLALHISLQISAKSSHAWPHFDEMSLFVQFDVCWQNVAFYALWRILAKCCDLRTLPGTKFWLPGTFNYSALLPLTVSSYVFFSEGCIWLLFMIIHKLKQILTKKKFFDPLFDPLAEWTWALQVVTNATTETRRQWWEVH